MFALQTWTLPLFYSIPLYMSSYDSFIRKNFLVSQLIFKSFSLMISNFSKRILNIFILFKTYYPNYDNNRIQFLLNMEDFRMLSLEILPIFYFPYYLALAAFYITLNPISLISSFIFFISMICIVNDFFTWSFSYTNLPLATINVI